MPIRNWGGGTDPSDTFLALQDQFLAEAQAARDRALAAAERAAAARGGGSGGGGGSSGGRRRSGSTTSSGVRQGVENIASRMARGQTNWKELLNFYRDELKYAKRGSALERELKANIQNIEFLLEANGVPIPPPGPSTISNPEEAGPDWGVLTEDDIITPEVERMINDQVLYVTVTENGVYPAGENPMASIVEKFLVDGTVEELRDGLIADAKLHEQALEDFMSGRSGGILIDPVSRRPLEMTSDSIMDFVFQGLNNQYTLLGLERGLGPDGDFAGRLGHLSNFMNKTDDLVSDYVFVAPDPETGKIKNWDGVNGYMDMIHQNFNILRATALESLDPYEAQEIFRAAGRSIARETAATREYLSSFPAGIGADEDTLANLEFSESLGNFMFAASTGTLSVDEINQNAAELIDRRPSGFYFTEEELKSTLGAGVENVGNQTITDINRDSPGWSGIVGVATAVEGLETGNAIRNGAEGEIIEGNRFVWVARYGESVPTPVRESDVEDWLDADGSYQEVAAPSIEAVVGKNGKRTLQQVWRQYAPLSSTRDTNWWAQVDVTGAPIVDMNGDKIWATPEQQDTWGNDVIRARAEGYQLMPMDATAGILQYIGADGAVHYVTEMRTGIHESMPLNTAIDGQFTPGMLVDENGHMDLSYIPRDGRPIGVGPGVTDREAQEFFNDLLASGEYPEDLFTSYGPDGVAREDQRSFMAGDFSDLLWSPLQEPGWQHGQRRSDYQSVGRAAALARAERDAAHQRMLRGQEEQMQEQMLREKARTDSFGAEALQDNAIEAAMQSAGVQFGRDRRGIHPNRGPQPEPRQRPTPDPVHPQFRDRPEPVTIDDLSPEPTRRLRRQRQEETPQHRTLPNTGGARPY